MTIRTPTFHHILKNFANSVYEPAEDTFLLIDALEQDLPNIMKQRPQIVLEVGSGSGIVITALASVLKTASYYISTDINKDACAATSQTAQQNGVCVEAVTTNLLDTLMPRIRGQVDLLVFNPPYVVTPSEEVGKGDLSSAWAGGINGREVLDKLLPLIGQILSPGGSFYLVVIKENKPDEIIEIMDKFGFCGDVLKTRQTRGELLSIVKFCRRTIH